MRVIAMVAGVVLGVSAMVLGSAGTAGLYSVLRPRAGSGHCCRRCPPPAQLWCQVCYVPGLYEH